MRSKEMKRRNKITQEIVSKSPPKKKVRSIYVPSTVVDVISSVKSISKKNASNSTAQRQTYKTEEEKAEIAGKSILGLSKANVFAKKLKKRPSNTTTEGEERERRTTAAVHRQNTLRYYEHGIRREAATTY